MTSGYSCSELAPPPGASYMMRRTIGRPASRPSFVMLQVPLYQQVTSTNKCMPSHAARDRRKCWSALVTISGGHGVAQVIPLPAIPCRLVAPAEFESPKAPSTTVLVSGATGRVGRVLVRKLLLRGYKVCHIELCMVSTFNSSQ
jgi:hypothetical protein